jgi:hypothetical protein
MTATATPGLRESSHIAVTQREFERRLVAHGHSESEIERLWNELAAAEPATERTIGLGPLIAVYLGALLLVAAFASLAGTYWETLDPWGVLALGAAYLAGFAVAGEVLRRRSLVQPGALLQIVAVGFVPVVTYAVERVAGLWPEGASHLGYIHYGITSMAIAGLVAAVVLLARRPDPLVLVPLGAATALLAADFAELLLGNDVSHRAKFAFVLPVGLAWIAGGLWLDVRRRRPYATWAHWAGLAATAAGLLGMLVPPTAPGWVLIGVLGAVSLFFSALVRHWSFTVVGAVGVLWAVGGLLGMLGGVAPVAIAVLGVLFIVLGLRWSRWREPIRAAVLAGLPARARALVTRLAP